MCLERAPAMMTIASQMATKITADPRSGSANTRMMGTSAIASEARNVLSLPDLLLAVGQILGQDDDQHQLRYLGGLDRRPRYLDPASGAVYGGGDHQHEHQRRQIAAM